MPQRFQFDPVTNKNGIADHSNELEKYRDFNLNVGGPIRKDKVWWYVSYRDQKTSVQQANFIGPLKGQLFDTRLWNPSGKVTYQLNQNNKLIGYYQWGQKAQPNRTPSSSFFYTDVASTFTQDLGQLGLQGGVERHAQQQAVRGGALRRVRLLLPLIANSDTTAPRSLRQLRVAFFGADEKEQTDRHRGQLTGSLTYFKDGWGGSHNFKIGGELTAGKPAGTAICRWPPATFGRRLPATGALAGRDVRADRHRRSASWRARTATCSASPT